jgi:hypothetical protein
MLCAASILAGLSQVNSPRRPADAAQHLMRVYNVMGGAGGDSSIQYVELRMASAGQTFVNLHDICFFDAAGAPWAQFTFPANVANGAGGSSVLVGTAAMDAAWAAGSPDFTFSPANTTAINAAASPSAPIPQPAGKIAFGNDMATDPAQMCQASFSAPYDSLAYGIGYAGTADFPPKFPLDLPAAATQAIKLAGELCNPCPRSNAADYSLVDANAAGNQPRNNAGQSGPIGPDGGPAPTPGATPTPAATPPPDGTPPVTPAPTPTPAPPPGEIHGDADCSGTITAVDSLFILREVAGLDVSGAGCLHLGDADCNGERNSVDALHILRQVAQLPKTTPGDCPEVGTPL